MSFRGLLLSPQTAELQKVTLVAGLRARLGLSVET